MSASTVVHFSSRTAQHTVTSTVYDAQSLADIQASASSVLLSGESFSVECTDAAHVADFWLDYIHAVQVRA